MNADRFAWTHDDDEFTKLKITVTAENGTGGFAQLDNAAGSVSMVIPDKAGAASSFKGTLNKFNSAAAGELGF